MTLKEVTEKFFQLEDELDLFNRDIDGVRFWERRRFTIYEQILQSIGIGGLANIRTERTFVNIAKNLLLLAKNLVIKNPYFVSPSEILFLGSPRRKLQEDGKWWDIYCDPIIEDLKRNYVYFEFPYVNRHFIPAKTKNIRYLDLAKNSGLIKYELRLVAIKLTKEDKLLIRNIQDLIYSQFNVNINLEDIVRQDLLVRRSTLPLYQRILEKVKPKLVIVVCSYGHETFIEACKVMNIPVAELQHGIISHYHLGYSYPGPNRTKRTFPDYFLAFGEFWENCLEYPIPNERIYSVGFPYLEKEAKKYINVPQKGQILFISQETIGKELSKFAVELSKRNNFAYKIVYKLHPSEYLQWQRNYPWLIDTDIRIIDNDSVPLYRLFAESKVQLGVGSTAIYEGLFFGLKTYLLNLPRIEDMEPLIKNQYATVVTSVDELIAKLEDGQCNGPVDTEQFFKRNSIHNISKAIDDIISSSWRARTP